MSDDFSQRDMYVLMERVKTHLEIVLEEQKNQGEKQDSILETIQEMRLIDLDYKNKIKNIEEKNEKISRIVEGPDGTAPISQKIEALDERVKALDAKVSASVKDETELKKAKKLFKKLETFEDEAPAVVKRFKKAIKKLKKAEEE